ncbi:MAG: hypothetical protein CL840_07475 [Crocinitomicaceae bacterium]|nr:hypothetical protein [Crocinitomicaceae bacterium]|tara:strand:- start:15092 stop:15763 length:672 start_codon:yes stop_codon:yes gene_type:complete
MPRLIVTCLASLAFGVIYSQSLDFKSLMKKYSSANQLHLSSTIYLISINNPSVNQSMSFESYRRGKNCLTITNGNETYFDSKLYIQVDHKSKSIAIDSLNNFIDEYFDFFNEKVFENIVIDSSYSDKNGTTFLTSYKESGFFSKALYKFSPKNELQSVTFSFSNENPYKSNYGFDHYVVDFEACEFTVKADKVRTNNYFIINNKSVQLAESLKSYRLISSILN